jgi:hypothetical protein
MHLQEAYRRLSRPKSLAQLLLREWVNELQARQRSDAYRQVTTKWKAPTFALFTYSRAAFAA